MREVSFMTTVKQKRTVSILLIAIMLLTGMCFVGYEADSFFAYEASSQSIQPVLSGAKRVNSQAFCTEELLGGQSLGSVADQVDGAGAVTNLMTAVLLSSTGNFLHNLTLSLAWMNEEAGCVDGRAAIIGYIHRQDGSKG